MKKVCLFVIVFFGVLSGKAQSENFDPIFDSIIKEANILFRYEKAVWNSTDRLLAETKLKNDYGGYVVYHSGDTVSVAYVNKKRSDRIAFYSYTSSNLEVPLEFSDKKVPLNPLEQELLTVKVKMLEQLSDPKYEVTIADGYSPNLILLKETIGYKLYIIMGTSKSGVIPFGNDYLFNGDTTGTIIRGKKFHSRMIPTESRGPNGEKVFSAIHSHLKTTPHITATDICTFRLYGELCGMEEFKVYCPATNHYYTYNRITNTIVAEKS
jgi:hypothetical protein